MATIPTDRNLMNPMGDFALAVAIGAIPGWATYREYGMNPALSSGTEDMWPLGTPRVLPTTDTVVSVVSSSTADDAAAVGTGAWTVVVVGLDEDGLEQEETITLDGQVSVNGLLTFSRLNSMYVNTAGTGKVNAGNITASMDSGKAQAYIEANEGQSHQVLLTVPSNKTLVLTRLDIGSGRLQAVDLAIQTQIRPPHANAAWRSISDTQVYETHFIDLGTVIVPSSTEMRMRCVATGAGEAHGSLSGYIVENTAL